MPRDLQQRADADARERADAGKRTEQRGQQVALDARVKPRQRAKRVRVARAAERRGVDRVAARDAGEAAVDARGGSSRSGRAATPRPRPAGPAPGTRGWWRRTERSRRRRRGRKPGSVSASLPSAPPARRGFASSTSTRNPRRARTLAAASPFGPEPITTMSGSIVEPPARDSSAFWLAPNERLRRAIAPPYSPRMLGAWTGDAGALLERAVARHGGWAAWQALHGVTLELRALSGMVPALKGAQRTFPRPSQIQVFPHEHRVVFDDYPARGHRGLFTAGAVQLLSTGGAVIEASPDHRQSFRGLRKWRRWSPADALYFWVRVDTLPGPAVHARRRRASARAVRGA